MKVKKFIKLFKKCGSGTLAFYVRSDDVFSPEELKVLKSLKELKILDGLADDLSKREWYVDFNYFLDCNISHIEVNGNILIVGIKLDKSDKKEVVEVDMGNGKKVKITVNSRFLENSDCVDGLLFHLKALAVIFKKDAVKLADYITMI